MKLMKHITIALVLCAIPAVAAAQEVTCESCTHVVSVFQGSGGLVAEADGADMVTWVSTCGSVIQSGELTPTGDNNRVNLHFGDAGIECHDEEGGELEIGPVMDGGWFYLTRETNSAIGNLVDKAILDNMNTVEPADAGNDDMGEPILTKMDGDGATLLRDASGRMGLLPTILPVADVEATPANTCSYTGAGTAASAYMPETSNCMLGNGGSAVLVQGPIGTFTGMREHLAANATVVRPAAGSVTVLADLWGNGTGHFVSAYDAAENGANARLGHAGGIRLAATIAASLAAAGPGTGTPIGGVGSEVAGMSLDASTVASLGELTIGQDAAYCNPTANPPVNHTATVTFTATLTADQKTQVTPTLTTAPAAEGTAARHTIMVVCPTASANMGVELVPDNPFPTDK